MPGDDAAHTPGMLRVRVALCPPPPVARTVSYPSWKVIVSASYGQYLKAGLARVRLFFCGSVDRTERVTPQGDVLSRVLQSNFTRASRNAFAITLKDDSAIASAPSIGDSRMPNTGYSAPAAIGTPAAL